MKIVHETKEDDWPELDFQTRDAIKLRRENSTQPPKNAVKILIE